MLDSVKKMVFGDDNNDDGLERQKAQEEAQRKAQEEAQEEAQKQAFKKSEQDARKEILKYAELCKIELQSFKSGYFTHSSIVKVLDCMYYCGCEKYEELKQLRREKNAEIKALKSYIAESGNDEGYQRWKKAQKNGRKKSVIDWEKYDTLKSVGLTEKDCAKYLGVSVSTLRTRVKERNA